MCSMILSTLSNPMSGSLPGLSVPWAFRAKILEQLASIPKDLPDPGIERRLHPALAGGFFAIIATWKPHWHQNDNEIKPHLPYLTILPSFSPLGG